jgi:hypothetical protein
MVQHCSLDIVRTSPQQGLKRTDKCPYLHDRRRGRKLEGAQQRLGAADHAAAR